MDTRLCNSYLEVNLGILRENVEQILSELREGVGLIPVLKDDLYGLGAIPAAKLYCGFPEIRCFAVSQVQEGAALREAGIDREILVMGNTPAFQEEAAIAADLTLTCGRLGFLKEVAAAARKIGTRAKFQLKIDAAPARASPRRALRQPSASGRPCGTASRSSALPASRPRLWALPASWIPPSAPPAF